MNSPSKDPKPLIQCDRCDAASAGDALHRILIRVRSVALAALIGLGCVACSDSSGSGLSTPATDAIINAVQDTSGDSVVGACDLLAAGDIEAVGFTVLAGPAPDETVPGDECIFELPMVENSVVPGRATVWLFPAEFGATFGPGLHADSVTLGGIGAEAWSSSSNRVAEARLDDGRVVSVMLTATGPDDPTAAVVALLATAVGRA